MRSRVVFAGGIAALLTLSLSAQDTTAHDSATAQSDKGIIRSSTQEVMVDVIVRDKKERFIRDLNASDVQVLEDGVPQKVRSFRLIDGRQALTASEEKTQQAKQGQLQSLPEINVISIIFDQMSPKTRQYAHEAATEFVNHEIGPYTYVGVFSLDYRLNALERYTHDRDKVITAINRASTGNYNDFRRQSDAVLNSMPISWGVAGPSPSGGPSGMNPGGRHVAVQGGEQMFNSPSGAVAGADVSLSEGQQMLAYVQEQQLETVSNVVGWRSLEALLNIIRAQSILPGRKTVLYLTEGLNVPDQAHELFRNVIGAANRANVTFYAIDVTGLTTTSPGRSGIDRMRNAAAISQTQGANPSADGAPSLHVADQMNQDDSLLLAMSSDQQVKLRELADGTGGFLIANTNDFKRPLERIMEDAHTHYEIAYSPASANYDGKFRKIEVKVMRKDARVQSRNGYFALPSINGQPVAPFELACLKAIDADPAPKAFPMKARALQVGGRDGEVEQSIVFEVPMKNLTFTEVENSAAGTTRIRTHLSFLALVKDEHGQVVSKISRDLPVSFPADKKDEHRRGNYIYYQTVWTPPGKYTLEAAAVDHEGDESSTLEVPVKVDAPSALSDVILVRQVEPLRPDDNPADPMVTSGGRVVPTLSTTIPTESEVPVFFVLHAAAGEKAPDVTVELYRSGQLIAKKAPELPKAEPDGSYRVVTGLTVDPGSYEVRVTAQTKNGPVTKRVAFTMGS